MNQNNLIEEDEIDLGELFFALLHHAFLIILAGVVCGALAYGYSTYLVTPLYDASALMIVNSGDRGTDYVSQDQIKSSTLLVDTYSIIVTSNTVMDQVYENLDMGEDDREEVISVDVSAVNDTQVMQITVTATKPGVALNVCNEITKVAPDEIIEAVEAGSVKVVEKAKSTFEPVSPNIKKYTVLGAAAGIFLAAALVVLLTLLNNKVKGEKDIQQMGLSVLGVIPSYNQEGR